MIGKVGHSGWAWGRKKDRAGDRAFARLVGAMCECDMRLLDFAGILDGP
jgi:hypothetical protein